MFVETLAAPTRELLERLGRRRWMTAFYLAGGSGAALHLGHRISDDLDFFTAEALDTRLLLQRVKRTGAFTVHNEAWVTLAGELSGVRTSFFQYQYPLVEPVARWAGIRIAGLRDVGLMKLVAIAQRGSRRDFVDLYFICRRVLPLSELLRLRRQEFPNQHYNGTHLYRSLVYFADAEAEPMPRMLAPVRWSQVKRFFEQKVTTLAKRSFR